MYVLVIDRDKSVPKVYGPFNSQSEAGNLGKRFYRENHSKWIVLPLNTPE